MGWRSEAYRDRGAMGWGQAQHIEIRGRLGGAKRSVLEIRGRWGGAMWRTIVSGTPPTPMCECVAEANPSPWFRVCVDMPLFWETSMVVGFLGFAEE
jgi:hypothetical protein